MCSCRLAGRGRKSLQQTCWISSAGYMISLFLCKIHMVLSYCHRSLKGSIQSGDNLNSQGVSTRIPRLCPEEDLDVPRWCLLCSNSQTQTCFMYSFEIKTLNKVTFYTAMRILSGDLTKYLFCLYNGDLIIPSLPRCVLS